MNSSSKQDFVEIIKKYQRIISSLCSIYYTSEEDRKDTRQDIILQLWKSFTNFRNESKISTWIYKVALNTILSKTKKERRQVFTEPLSYSNMDKLPSLSFANDEVQHLQQAIQLLEDIDKAIVILYLEGYHHKEIASTLGLTETNISTRFSRIKIRLQKYIKLVNMNLNNFKAGWSQYKLMNNFHNISENEILSVIEERRINPCTFSLKRLIQNTCIYTIILLCCQTG